MKRPLLVGAFAMLLAAGIYRIVQVANGGETEVERPPIAVEPADESLGLDWARARPPGWPCAIEVPRAWAGTAKTIGDGREWHFVGPGEPGRKPEMTFGWMQSGKGLAFGEQKLRTLEDSPFYKLIRRGRTTVGGMPAIYGIFSTETKVGQLRRIEYHFAGDGGIGLLRGIAPARAFELDYRPIFEEAARRVSRR